MTAAYDGAADRWAGGATLVYGPIARELARRSPHPLTDRVVLDVGAGTGVGSTALLDVGARPVALDLSADMLAWNRTDRPPSMVASVEQVPVAARSVDDVYASFVLNHVPRPVEVLRELAATARPGGAVLATVYANASTSPARDRIDEAARAHGWQPPGWYADLKADIAPLLGTRDAMGAAAREAGLTVVDVAEEPVDVGVTRPDQLVDYRLGQAHVSAWLATISAEATLRLRADAIEAVGPTMAPYRPGVVFLVATVPG